ncbi:LysR family substrate-binding domain-containing protein [Streptomyces triculaminicus]|uniref:LysR family substrate-binding domain-containing protein n=2 Tax=Streptomyces TaxID=1883 RepID=A0A939FLQ4_9ACTN|nr:MULTISPECIES: LysR family substrate-binding domain-containing protein [Streptomyces]MBO0654335.1 LysR family substrate-binding domain-containing protein [Streptomyces triculaminicus]QSY48971.1 LysR family substrate-binding domain-containing protein [Streptomyces griseocarneus]
MTGSETHPSFRLAYVPGVMPTKWVRIWNERLPDIPLDLVSVPAAAAGDLLRDGGADAGLVRLPVDRTVLSAIPLYTETTVVVIPKDHLFMAVEEVSAADLADDVVFHPLDDTLDWEHPPGRPAIERPATTADAIELVAAGVGLLVVPQSLARLHHRKDLTYRPITDTPQSSVALSWPEEKTTDLVEDFIGIVRGRTVNSTRGRSSAQAPAQPKSKRPDRKPAGDKSAAGRTAGKGAGKAGGGKGARGGSGGGPKGAKRGKPRRRP